MRTNDDDDDDDSVLRSYLCVYKRRNGNRIFYVCVEVLGDFSSVRVCGHDKLGGRREKNYCDLRDS